MRPVPFGGAAAATEYTMRSASARRISVNTSRVRSNLHASRTPPMKTAYGSAGTNGAADASKPGTDVTATAASTRRPPGISLRMRVFTRGGSALLSRPDMKVTAAVATRLPRVGPELEARGLEGAVVDAARDAAQPRHVRVGQPGPLPCLFQWAALELDVE